MGDPFSVAGTAVGITSLGIQTCQVLYNYYSQYKGYHDDIDNVLRQVEGLQGILDSLRQVKDRFEIDNHEPSSQLHMALKACEEALARLKAMADKCTTVKHTDGL
jgi:Xaa-Pro aminopeptidase